MYEAYRIKTGFKLQLIGLILLILSITAFAGFFMLRASPAGNMCFIASIVLMLLAKGAMIEGLRLQRFP